MVIRKQQYFHEQKYIITAAASIVKEGQKLIYPQNI
jgi:hypothetical protein